MGSDDRQATRSDWLYRPQFPESWPRRSLYSLATWANGIAFRDVQFAPTGKPVIKIAEVKDGLSPQTKYTAQTFDAAVHVEPGDMIFSWSGQPETSIDVFWWRGRDGWLNQHLFKVTPRAGVDPAFLYYVLRYLRPNFVAIARNKQTTGLGHVTKRDLEAIRVGVPSLSEQRGIVSMLSALDDKIELNRRMSQTLELMARALFKSWFVDFDPVRVNAGATNQPVPKEPVWAATHSFIQSAAGPIPEGWRVGTLAELIEVMLGGDWGSDDVSGSNGEATLCIRGADMPDLQRSGRGRMPIRFLAASSLGKRRLADGDLVIEVSGGSPTQSTGRAVLVTEGLLKRNGLPLACSNFCRSVRLRSRAAAEFVYFWLRQLYDDDELLTYETGTTGIKNFAISRFVDEYPLVLPQLPWLEAFSSSVRPLLRMEDSLAAHSDALADTRNSLLPRLLGPATNGGGQ